MGVECATMAAVTALSSFRASLFLVTSCQMAERDKAVEARKNKQMNKVAKNPPPPVATKAPGTRTCMRI